MLKLRVESDAGGGGCHALGGGTQQHAEEQAEIQQQRMNSEQALL